MKNLLILVLLLVAACAGNKVDKTPKEDTNLLKNPDADFYYTLEEVEKKFGIKLHSSCTDVIKNSKNYAQKNGYDFKAPQKEDFEFYSFEIEKRNRLSVSAYFSYKRDRKVRSLTIKYKELTKSPDKYVKDLSWVYGDFEFHFSRTASHNKKLSKEFFYWPTNHGGVVFEIEKEEENDGSVSCEYSITFCDRDCYIFKVQEKALRQTYEVLKSPLKDGAQFPTVKKTLLPKMYLTYEQINKKVGFHLNEGFHESFEKVKKVPKIWRPLKGAEYFDVEIDRLYKFNFRRFRAENETTNQVTVRHSKILGVKRKKVLEELKRLYGDYTHSNLERHLDYFEVNYIWIFDNYTAIKYTYSTKDKMNPHEISFHTPSSCINLLNEHLNNEFDYKKIYR